MLFRLPSEEELTDNKLNEFIAKHNAECAFRFKHLKDAYETDYQIFHQKPKPDYKPDNRIAVNFAKYMVDTFNGYFIGNPIKISVDGDAAGNIKKYVELLDQYNDQDDNNAELSKICCIYGKGYEMYYVDELGNIGITYLTPFDAFMIYDDSVLCRERYFVRLYIDSNNVLHGSVSDAEKIRWFIQKGKLIWEEEEKIHGFDGVPATEYVENKERTCIFAMAIGKVVAKFQKMKRTATGIAVWVNTLDVYKYLGAADITLQTAFGFKYMTDFLGADVVFVTSEIPENVVVATPLNNMIAYYVDPGDSEFARAGLPFTTDSETGFIGFHTEGTYSRMISDNYAIMGLRLFCEYLDAIAYISVGESDTQTLGTLNVTSEAGSEAGTTKLTVKEQLMSMRNCWKYKDAAAATAVTYGMDVKNWSKWDGESEIASTATHHITLVECDQNYKAVRSGDVTVTVNELEVKLKKNMDLSAVKTVVKKNGAEMQKKAMQNAPIDTGHLRGSITLEITDNGKTAEVESTADYAAYQEYGTRFMKGKPHVKPAFDEQKEIFVSDLKKLVR